MTEKTFAQNSEEFDRRFDAGEDIHDLVDLSQATVTRPGKKIRLTLDFSINRDSYLFSPRVENANF